MLTIAHELAHLWLNTGGIFNLGKEEIEIRCSNIAVEFLAPESEFRKLWKENQYRFDSISESFKVNPIVCAIDNADPYLIAFALTNGYKLVTMEKLNLCIKKKVLIPNVCKTFKVECINTFDMLKELKASL